MRIKSFAAGLIVALIIGALYFVCVDYLNTRKRVSNIEQFLAKALKDAQAAQGPVNAPTPSSRSSKTHP